MILELIFTVDIKLTFYFLIQQKVTDKSLRVIGHKVR